MKTLLLTTSLVLCTTAAAFAQTADTTDADMTASATDQAAVPNYTRGTMMIGADTMVGQRFYIGRDGATQMDDTALTDGMSDASGDWNDAGDIADVLVSGDGQIMSVVVNSGGFLGIGERQVLVPVDNLQFVRDSDTEADYFIVYNSDLATFEDTPDYDQGTSAGEGILPYGQGGMSDIAAAKAEESATDGAAGSGETPGGQGTESAMATNIGEDEADAVTTVPGDAAAGDVTRPDRDAMTGIDAETLTADDLTGARVYGSADNWIGEVDELVLAEDGKISQIVIDVGGWLGMGERPVALGFDQLDIRRDDGVGSGVIVYVDATEAELEALPEWQG
jgi:hypothetical protein